MLDQIARGFLLFSNDLIIIPILIIGYIWLDRTTFYHAICLLLISIMVNVALKVSFQIPLAPSLGKKGYAFPSGHMQSVTVLYTWLVYKLQNFYLRLILVPLLIGIGLSLMHFGYHNYYDVLAGVFFALVLFICYSLVFLKWPQTISWFVLITANLLLIYIYWCIGEIPSHVWMAYYALWGIIIAEKMSSKKVKSGVCSHRVLATLVCFLALLLIQIVFSFISQPVSIKQLQWLTIGFIIPWIKVLVNGKKI